MGPSWDIVNTAFLLLLADHLFSWLLGGWLRTSPGRPERGTLITPAQIPHIIKERSFWLKLLDLPKILRLS